MRLSSLQHPPSPPPSIPSGARSLKLALPGILIAIACLVPYLNKAYTIDDPWFLLSARQIILTPLQPMSFPICWMGHDTCVERAAGIGPGAAQGLMGYLLVPVVLLGAKEWIGHLLQILLGCIAVWGTVKFALRLGFDRVQAAWAGVFLVVTPPFLPMASTVMPDIAALTFGLAGMERLLAWKAERRWHQAILAGVALGLAPYGRMHLALLLPLGALWLFDSLRWRPATEQLRRQMWLWIPVALAGGILMLVVALTRDRGPAMAPASNLVGFAHLPRNVYSYLLYLAFPIPFAAVWIAVRQRRPVWKLALSFAPLALFVSLLSWPMAAALYGLAALALVLHRSIQERDRSGLLLGLWLLLPLPTIFFHHLPIKYFVPVLPAITLILVRALSELAPARRLAACVTLTAACAAYSCVILKADADFAEDGRRAAADLIAPHVAGGEKVWFSGQWGFLWYAQEAGAVASNPARPGPLPGELLAIGVLERGGESLWRFPKRELIAKRSYRSPHGRTVAYGGALYSNFLGDALWVWTPEATSDYELWRVR